MNKRYAVERDDLFGGYLVIDTTIEDGEACNVFGSFDRKEAEAKREELNEVANEQLK